ncbi:S-adenosylmethionine-dependent methyltransferase [Xylographa carneopallida]|nr:S-adenosylmethionine-dependent methyltransferase [Xylographa carneopallida]
MLPTPSTSHIDTNRIYDPAEDSYLLLDTLSAASEIQYLRERFDAEQASTSSIPLVLEVGTGSGVIIAFISANSQNLFGRADVLSIGIDINEYACHATKETVRRACEDAQGRAESQLGHATFIGALQADLTSAIKPAVVDVLVFNPPYVPTPELPEAPLDYKDDFTSATKHEKFDEDSHLLSLSYAGGKDGMEITNRLLDQLPHMLSEKGVAYVLLCQQNKPDQVVKRIQAWGPHWAVVTVRRSGKAAGWEKLRVIRIWRTTETRLSNQDET